MSHAASGPAQPDSDRTDADQAGAAPSVPTLADLEREARGVAGAVRLHITGRGATGPDRTDRVQLASAVAGLVDTTPPLRGTLEEVRDGELVIRAPGILRDHGPADGFVMVQVQRRQLAWGCRGSLVHVADVAGVGDELRYVFACDPAHAWVPSRRSWRYRLPDGIAASAGITPLVENAPPQPGGDAPDPSRRPRPLEALAVRARLVDVGEGGVGCETGGSARSVLETFDRFLLEVPPVPGGGRGFAAVVRRRNARDGDGGRLLVGFEFEHARVPESMPHAYVLTDVTRFVAEVSGSDAVADGIRAA